MDAALVATVLALGRPQAQSGGASTAVPGSMSSRASSPSFSASEEEEHPPSSGRAPAASTAPTVWQELPHPQFAGYTYWWNAETNEVKWEAPVASTEEAAAVEEEVEEAAAVKAAPAPEEKKVGGLGAEAEAEFKRLFEFKFESMDSSILTKARYDEILNVVDNWKSWDGPTRREVGGGNGHRWCAPRSARKPTPRRAA